MIRNSTTIVVALFGLVSTIAASATVALGQEYPCTGVGDIAAANAQFDAQFDQLARYASWQIARNMRPGEQLPFNAMTISKSISEGNDAALGYVDSSIANGNIACAAVERWDVGAIQGNWFYGGNGCPTYVLPYTQNSYNIQNGYIYPGYVQGGQNLYPMYYGGR